MTIWPRKHKRKMPSQAFTRSKQIYRTGRSLKFCGTVHVCPPLCLSPFNRPGHNFDTTVYTTYQFDERSIEWKLCLMSFRTKMHCIYLLYSVHHIFAVIVLSISLVNFVLWYCLAQCRLTSFFWSTFICSWLMAILYFCPTITNYVSYRLFRTRIDSLTIMVMRRNHKSCFYHFEVICIDYFYA